MTEPPSAYGERRRGISVGDVERAADALLRSGHRPTIERIREKLGTGSPNTINPLLDAWWRRLSARLDSGPAALHRLPESIAHLAEGLWLQALDEGRRRAAQEQGSATRTLATEKQTLDLRSHVLSLREGELESRLHDREQRQAALEAQVQELTSLLRKEQTTREAQARRIAALEGELLARPPSTQVLRPRRKSKARTRPRKSQHAVPRKRNVAKSRKTTRSTKANLRERP
jgi:uncharacterized coiled-coil protein SlyX